MYIYLVWHCVNITHKSCLLLWKLLFVAIMAIVYEHPPSKSTSITVFTDWGLIIYILYNNLALYPRAYTMMENDITMGTARSVLALTVQCSHRKLTITGFFQKTLFRNMVGDIADCSWILRHFFLHAVSVVLGIFRGHNWRAPCSVCAMSLLRPGTGETVRQMKIQVDAYRNFSAQADFLQKDASLSSMWCDSPSPRRSMKRQKGKEYERAREW